MRPRKRFGQHFLIDPNIQRKIVAACEISSQDRVLEIGAGRGELTRWIRAKTPHLIALEIDSRLLAALQKSLLPQGTCASQAIIGDILKIDIGKLFRNYPKIKVIGNLPYNITTPIITHLLRFRAKIDCAFITVQKEFARRMVASAGTPDWSALACFVQYYAQARLLFGIKKTCFWPQPEVDSIFVKLAIKEQLPLDLIREKKLFQIIRAAFSKRRKVLRNALYGVVQPQAMERFFTHYNFDPNIRGEELSIKDFINLTNALN